MLASCLKDPIAKRLNSGLRFLLRPTSLYVLMMSDSHIISGGINLVCVTVNKFYVPIEIQQSAYMGSRV